MKLKSVRIKQFRSINDSGEFVIESAYTILAGKNESGKSNVMKALEKLSVTTNPIFNETEEKPTWVTSEAWQPSISYKFKLDDAEKQEIQTRFQLTLDTFTLTVTKPDANGISKTIDTSGFDFSNVTVPEGQEPETVRATTVANFCSYIDEKKPKIIFHPNFLKQLPGSFTPNCLQDERTKVMLNRLERYLSPTTTFSNIFSNQNPTSRAQVMDSLSQTLNCEFVRAFTQNDCKLYLTHDTNTISIFVKDLNVDEGTTYESTPLTIDKRSEGFQWYFNFFVTLKAESPSTGSILLLDEPGIHLHPKAQREMLDFIKAKSQEYQIIFSSHSPYLIDVDKIESVRIVEKTAVPQSRPSIQATTVNEKIHGGTETDALKPIIDAIGYAVPDLNFDANKPLIICEGVSDYFYIKALCKHKNISLDNVMITYASNADKTSVLYTLYVGLGVKDIYVILDADKDGKAAYKELMLKCGVPTDRLIFVTGATLNATFNDFSNGSIKGVIEELFNQQFFLTSFQNAPHIDPQKFARLVTANKTNIEILKEYEGRQQTTAKYTISKHIFDSITPQTQNAFGDIANSLVTKLQEITRQQ